MFRWCRFKLVDLLFLLATGLELTGKQTTNGRVNLMTAELRFGNDSMMQKS